jgi:putative cell wall-binding protein
LVGAGVAGLLVVGLAPVLTSEVSGAASLGANPPAFLSLDQRVIGTGQAGSAGGDIRIGTANDTFDAGDQITLQVAQPGVGTPVVGPTQPQNANCNDSVTGTTQSGVGDRRFVSFAATPTASGPSGGTLTLLPGVPSSSTAAGANGTVPGFCNVQDGGTKIDIYVFTVATAGPGPIVIGNVKYDVGRGTGQPNNAGATTRLNSTTTGPVRIFMFFSNVKNGVTTLTKANSADGVNVSPNLDSNAWVTTNTLTGPPKAFTTTIGGTNIVKTISGVTIAEQVADAWGAAGTINNTFCIDIASGNAVFLSSPSLTVTGSGLATDLLQSIVVPDSTGPGGANARVSITIANNPANVLSTLTLNNLRIQITPNSVGSVRVILTDCGDQAGPGGSLRGQAAGDANGGALVSATNPIFGAPNGGAVNPGGPSTNVSFSTIGNFSGPNPSDPNDLNRVIIFFLLLADRSGGNDRVATARILQQEKYGLSGVNVDLSSLNPINNGIPCTQSVSLAQVGNGIPQTDSNGTQLSGTITGTVTVVQNNTAIIPICGGTRFALVATADNFPDALSASYLAGRAGAAILLVRPTVDALAQVQLALTNLGVKVVFVLGGPAAVPDTVVDFLKGLNTSCTTDSLCGSGPNSLTNGDPRVAPGTKLSVARIQDPLNDTRYGTMRLINIATGLPISIPVAVQQAQPALFNATLQKAPASPVNTCSFCRSAFLVSGANFPDALSVGVRAYADGIPLILTDPAALSPEARQTLLDLQTQQVYIIGGTAAVSQAVQDELTKATQDGGLGVVVARISGADRLATAVAVHQFATRAATNTTLPGLSRLAVTTILLARGDTFPDSLTAAVQGVGSLRGVQTIIGNGGFGTGADPNKLNYGGEASILLTVNPTTLGASTQGLLATVGSSNGGSLVVNAIKCLGLQAAISDATCTAAQNALAGITT